MSLLLNSRPRRKGEENPASTNIKTMTIRRVKQNWGDIKVDPQFTGEDLENTDDEEDLSASDGEVIEEDEELNKEEEEKDEVGEEGQAEGVKPEEIKTEESDLPKKATRNTERSNSPVDEDGEVASKDQTEPKKRQYAPGMNVSFGARAFLNMKNQKTLKTVKRLKKKEAEKTASPKPQLENLTEKKKKKKGTVASLNVVFHSSLKLRYRTDEHERGNDG
ncbi:hypothetical protein BSL78_25337 [Apostichopus japonicus]|uniref:Uncharacterized protein n=1 Tax=Stichopus japonicus TaxID=307972 RepID=A0A2G8JQ44_STIJA|nr:hypothetical protein BSL78_25337 [Apostichopus japonicus]